jgi:hypothetical protein
MLCPQLPYVWFPSRWLSKIDPKNSSLSNGRGLLPIKKVGVKEYTMNLQIWMPVVFATKIKTVIVTP